MAVMTQRDDGFRRLGLAGALLQWWNERGPLRAGITRQMELLETLPLGGRRQLMLVRCGEERFLVGGGLDCVQSIVKIATQQDGVCG